MSVYADSPGTEWSQENETARPSGLPHKSFSLLRQFAQDRVVLIVPVDHRFRMRGLERLIQQADLATPVTSFSRTFTS